MHLGPVRVVHGPLAEHPHVERVVVGRGRVVAQLGVLDDDVAHVDAEAVDAAVEPEPEDAVEGVAHLVVPPVQVGLLPQVVVQVVLAGRGVERPCRSAEAADPVVRRRAVGLGVGPDVPVAPCRRRRRSRDRRTTGARSLVWFGTKSSSTRMPRSVRAGDQLVEVGEGSEVGLHRAVVGDVVAPVGVGRDGDRAQPDRVDAQPLQVVEPAR